MQLGRCFPRFIGSLAQIIPQTPTCRDTQRVRSLASNQVSWDYRLDSCRAQRGHMTMSRLELLSKYEVPVSQTVCHNRFSKDNSAFHMLKYSNVLNGYPTFPALVRLHTSAYLTYKVLPYDHTRPSSLVVWQSGSLAVWQFDHNLSWRFPATSCASKKQEAQLG